MVEELGDLLMQVVFHCQLAGSAARSILNSGSRIADKLCAATRTCSAKRGERSAEVLVNWSRSNGPKSTDPACPPSH